MTKDVVAALAAAEGADDDMAASVPRYNACIYQKIERMHLHACIYRDTTHAFTSVPRYNACIYQNPAIDVCLELLAATDALLEVLAACIADI